MAMTLGGRAAAEIIFGEIRSSGGGWTPPLAAMDRICMLDLMVAGA